MSRKRMKEWPPFGPPAVPPPPPRVNDGPARWVAWLPEMQGECGHTGFWRDQYLRLHCGVCEPVEERKPGRRGAGERGRTPVDYRGQAKSPLPPCAPAPLPAAEAAVQLRLF